MSGRDYVAMKIATTKGELIVQKALKDRGISGGCWNTIMRGRLPSRNMDAEGFRTVRA